MKNFLSFCFSCFIVILLAAPITLHAALIDFEDLSRGMVPQGYNGFSWTGDYGDYSWVIAEGDSTLSGFPTTGNSGINYAWSNGGVRLELTDDLFDINSLYMSSAYGTSSNPFVTFDGYLGGSLVYSTTVQVNDTSWTRVDLNFIGIDRFSFDGVPNTNLLIDDITYNDSAPVPEPATIILLGTGLLGLAGASRRKFKK